MASASTTYGKQTPSPEVSAPQTELEVLQKRARETRGILDSLCQLLIEGGLVSEQRLSVVTHRRSFAEVRRRHPCEWNTSLECALRSKDVAFNVASYCVNKTDCAGLRTASRTLDTCMAEVSSAMVRPKVVVWRGAFDVFDPVTRAWDTIPSAREKRPTAALAVISGHLYVCGGRSGNSSLPLAFLDRFDPQRGTWQTLPPMSQGRCDLAAAVLGAQLYVCGGLTTSAWPDNSAECFDAVTNVWEALPAMVQSRRRAKTAVIKNQVYVVGGDSIQPLSSERLLSAGHWQELPRMHHGRADDFKTAVVADRLYVCGGEDPSSVERFDPEAGVWELLQPMLEEHSCGAVSVLQGLLYLCGGMDGGTEEPSTVERFDPTRNTWEGFAPMSRAKEIAHAVVIDGRLFVCGHEAQVQDDGTGKVLSLSAEWYDPATRHWEFLRDMGEGEFFDGVFVVSC